MSMVSSSPGCTSSDSTALLEIGKSLNEKLDATEREKNSAKEDHETKATFLFDDSRSCDAWFAQGTKAMSDENFEEAASCFYQAMVGADSDDIAKAQRMLQTAVQAARSAKGLGMLALSSSSDEDDDY